MTGDETKKQAMDYIHGINIQSEQLTDGSVVWNVMLVSDDKTKVQFRCIDLRAALADVVKFVQWFDFVRGLKNLTYEHTVDVVRFVQAEQLTPPERKNYHETPRG